MTAFGQDGPRRTHTAYDHAIQATSGIMAMTGEEGGAPIKCGAPIIDYSTGTMAAFAIASALFFEWDWLTGGTLGIGGIPKLDLFGFVLDRPSRYYFLVWLVAFGCMALAANLVDSRTGLMLRAMRDSSTAAAAASSRSQGEYSAASGPPHAVKVQSIPPE